MEQKINSMLADEDKKFEIRIKEPGFLVKTYCKQYKFKFFINVCHSKLISSPTIQLDESELRDLISQEKYEELSKFTIPLVLEELRSTKDKKNEPAKMTYAIINSRFYSEKIMKSEIYKNYLIYIIIDTINSKFDIRLDNTGFIVMKNRRFQLADNEQDFPKFIDSYSVKNSNILDQSSIDESINSATADSIDIEMNDDEDELNQNVIITLDLFEDIVSIQVKFVIYFKKIQLQMNDDHIIIMDNGQIVREFYLPLQIDPTKAKATMKKSILKIICPIQASN